MGKFSRQQIDDSFLILHTENIGFDNLCRLSPREWGRGGGGGGDNLHEMSNSIF